VRVDLDENTYTIMFIVISLRKNGIHSGNVKPQEQRLDLTNTY